MNSILYHEKTKKDRLNRTIFIGEDAHPFADEQIIMVADGLGGRGGYPHTKIESRILEKESFYDFVFSPIFTESVSDDFKSFVVDSFDEIFKTKDYYFENSSTMRSSGYFASRLVSAIALYELMYNEYFDKEKLFSSINEATDDKKDSTAQEYGDKLAGLLHDKLSAVAKTMGLQVETKISGAYLLPSTLTLALIDDKEDHVDVVYFWAGDSRGYIWDENGLYQLTDDHEKDETMTNLITLSKPFRIESRFVSVKKPCLLFNATDGCYKCPVFGSSFDLEYVFLKSIDESNDWETSSDYLSKFFDELGRHDDSNTMALASCGFKNYADVQSAVRARLENIQNNIIVKLPGILEIDYPAKLLEVESQMKDILATTNDQLLEQEGVVSFVKSEMEKNSYPPLIREGNDLTEKINRLQAEKSEIEKIIEKWVKDHWIKYPQLKNISKAADDFIGRRTLFVSNNEDPYETYRCLRSKLVDIKNRYVQTVERIILELKAKNSIILDSVKKLKDFGKSDLFCRDDFAENTRRQAQILHSIEEISQGKDSISLEYRKTKGDINRLNDKYVDYDEDAIDAFCELLLDGKVNLNRIDRPKEEIAPLITLLNQYRELNDNVALYEKEMSKLDDKHFHAYWRENAKQLTCLIFEEHIDLVPESLVEAMNVKLAGLKTKQSELKLCCKIREELYNEYDESYRKFFKNSQIMD